MNCYTKIKRNLEICGGIKVKKRDNIITILKDNEILTTYDLRFVESKQNLTNFIEHWKYRLKIK